MATLALIVFLAALGFARSSRRRHLAKLSAEQKAAVMQALSADAVWPFAIVIILIVFPLRAPFRALSPDPRVQSGIAFFATVFLVSAAVAITQQVRVHRLALPRDYLRSSIIGAAAVHVILLVTLALGVRLALSSSVAAATRTPNQAMQLTAPRFVSGLRVATTFNLQPHALPGAVADLVSR